MNSTVDGMSLTKQMFAETEHTLENVDKFLCEVFKSLIVVLLLHLAQVRLHTHTLHLHDDTNLDPDLTLNVINTESRLLDSKPQLQIPI